MKFLAFSWRSRVNISHITIICVTTWRIWYLTNTHLFWFCPLTESCRYFRYHRTEQILAQNCCNGHENAPCPSWLYTWSYSCSYNPGARKVRSMVYWNASNVTASHYMQWHEPSTVRASDSSCTFNMSSEDQMPPIKDLMCVALSVIQCDITIWRKRTW